MTDVTGVDEICIRRASWRESRYEVAVRKPAKRSTGPMFNTTMAEIAVRRCLSARHAQKAKHARSSGLERPAGTCTVRSQQHRQMSAELRRWPRTIQGHFGCLPSPSRPLIFQQAATICIKRIKIFLCATYVQCIYAKYLDFCSCVHSGYTFCSRNLCMIYYVSV